MTEPPGARRLRIGMSLSAHYPPGTPVREALRETMEQVALAEEMGLSSILLGHHYLARSQFLQPLSTVAYLAARTERIRLGFGVYLLPLHNPLALAEEFATLDQLSGGRLIVGLGAGYRGVEFRAFGVPVEERFRRLEEYVGVLRALWSGEPVTASGSFGELAGARVLLRPVAPGGPPLWLGAFGPAGMRRVARLDAAWAVAPNGTVEEVAARMADFRAALAEHGRSADRDYPLLREGCVAPTRRQAVDAAGPYLAGQYENYRGWKHGTSAHELIEGHAVIGSPDDVAERLARYAAIGHTEVVLRLQWSGMPQADVLRSIRLLGREVLPALAEVPVGAPAPAAG
ncbi:N5,N10-methylene tetrahydromethanopterin reductase [Sphaerisporangium rufum]|uniref:N5,N10-methylene tetrahydromethanopterin reductase n=1 Tax=Sphaerisporangium rufum TaxID=1381558 RepID=A0A919R2K1_9ACTN|nr:LLM class flavin-dependent oxidoreductase [Sphaerisporangium rufum]GII78546.1 N5,N10-methylene tetrahydromethanopterin reductase [Sphaerisporangium rufum]